MKFVFLFICAGVCSLAAETTVPQVMSNVSLKIKNGTVLEALKAIENQSDYTFVYNTNDVNLMKTVTINADNKDLQDVLDSLFGTNEFGYRIMDNRHIALYRKAAVQQQSNVSIRGTITDDTGQSVIGANVQIVGTGTGTITDIDGKYELSVPSGAVLRISYVGFLTQEVKVAAGRTTYDIVLHEDAEALEEVVVIGYGVVKKSDVTGSITSVNTDEILKRTPISLVTGLQGAAAGVLVTRDGGPDGGSKIRIRGIASVDNRTDPLFVVDGIRVGDNVDYLNPADVLNIEILKDASATAIYGSQGANGVVMITTRKGEAGRARVSFSANTSVLSPSERIDVLDAAGFVNAARVAAANSGATLNTAWNRYDTELNYIDWQDEMSRTALQQTYNINVSGGSDATRAVMSIGYSNNQGVVIYNDFERLTARLAVDHTVKKSIRTGASIAYTYSRRIGTGSGMLTYAGIPPTMDDVDAQGNLIHIPVQYDNGTWGHFFHTGNDVNKSQDNPVAAATERYESGNYSYGHNVIANAYADIDLWKGLTFRSNAAYSYYGSAGSSYSPLNNRPQLNQNDDYDRFSLSFSQNIGLSLESYLTYNLTLADIHSIQAMAGHSISRNFGSNSYIEARYMPVPTIRQIAMTQQPTSITGSGGLNDETHMESFFGRLNYTLLGKYLLTASIRRDGSSNFGKGNRYGVFPSASLAYRLSEEDFIKDLNIFSNLKLRLGWGQVGNAGFSGDRAINQLSSSRIAYYYYTGTGSNGFTDAPGLAQTREIDTNLKWETNETTNVALDFGFMNNQLSFTAEYFIRDSKDLLLSRSLRPSSGYNDIYTNSGHIRNSGFELTATYQKPVGDWFFNARLSASTIKNEVIDVGEPIYNTTGNGDWWTNCSVTQNGDPLAAFYGLRVDGIFQTQAEIDALNAAAAAKGVNGGYYQAQYTAPGDYKFKDLDGNGFISTEDREYLGHGFPTLNYGLNLSVSYKNWDASLYLYGVAGQKILSYAYKNLTTMRAGTEGYTNILSDYAENAWTPENKSTEYIRLTRSDDNHNTQVSDAYLKDGDFLKIRNLQVGYTLPKNLLRTVLIDNARIFVSAEDLFTFSNYVANLDPELPIGNNSLYNSVLNTGVDRGHYPLPRTFTIGLTVGF
ncbi:MAG: TonB-dependent receptor [Tannerellaceae bacterium]|jgi:TonB-linked SusC/RagA family outer membrane protein|nr:TonB-dependent receptor [Tannerellaceae bacterium]